jgi:hypothetical protein
MWSIVGVGLNHLAMINYRMHFHFSDAPQLHPLLCVIPELHTSSQPTTP